MKRYICSSENLTRDEVLNKMYALAYSLYDNGYDRETERQIWRMAEDFNDEQEDESNDIFVAELGDKEITGFAIEDDVFYYKDMLD